MILFSDIVLTIAVLALCVPVTVFCLEVLLSLVPRRRGNMAALPSDSRVAVLIPAHNEEAVIAGTLATLMPTMPVNGRVVVVADNCTDRTAEIARSFGAETPERTDAVKRGKGFALDFGIRYLAGRPNVGCLSGAKCTISAPEDPTQAPHVIVFLDADCRVQPDTVTLLAAAAIETGRPVQGLNLCDPDPNGGVLQIISGLAFRFKNLVRALGLVRLTGMCHLTGTGMALPWNLAETAKLADGNVVEDMQLGLNLALTGKPAMFLPAARVDSPLPQQRAAARTQRTRWEHGHLKTLLTQTPRLLALALRHRRCDLAWLALDLAVPPLALLAIGLMATTAIAAAAYLAGASSVPFLITAIAGSALFLTVLTGWAIHCRHQVPFFAVLAAPFYVAIKLPIYMAFLGKRQMQWVRTQRDVIRAT